MEKKAESINKWASALLKHQQGGGGGIMYILKKSNSLIQINSMILYKPLTLSVPTLHLHLVCM